MQMPKNLDLSFSERLSSLGGGRAEEVIHTAKHVGTPIFTVNDLRSTQNTPAIMLRLLCIVENITREKFDDAHRYMSLQTCMSVNRTNFDRNNTKRTMVQSDITWNFLEKFLFITGYLLQDVALTFLERRTNRIFTVKRSDALEMIKDNPYHPSIDRKEVTSVE